jgi:23S rRNA (guanine2445-N2)-methyltransferase / 23S rRNA (guanine2069-N7)-methyltransferase
LLAPSPTIDHGKSPVLQLIATSAFGIESIVRYELSQLGYQAQVVSPGRIEFTGDLEALCRTNLWLRTADRVLVCVGRFPAPDFDALFESVKSLPWEWWIPPDGEFPVSGRSRKSQLTSVPAIQRAVKRAIVDRLLAAHRVSQLPETGPRYSIEVALLDDRAALTIDTTGPGLHKRGYHRLVGRAPLKETLAAALIQLSFWTPDRPLIDPFCGTGTIPIEAALIGRNMAPGLNRDFAAERWPQVNETLWQREREAARAKVTDALPVRIIGTDADEQALKLARHAAQLAGVDQDIHFQLRVFEQLTSRRTHGCVITNPPYGQRMGDLREAEQSHRSIPEVLRKLPTWSHFILTAFPDFERLIQKQADRRRKLYNGRIECTYYQFHGPKPGSDSPSNGNQEAECEPIIPAMLRQAFGGLGDKAREQAELFRSRLLKRARHLRRWPTRQDIHCYRLYERDIPEIPLVVDRYEDYLHVTEYERPHDRDVAQHADWLELMQRTAGEALEIDPRHVFLKTKHRQRGTMQHEKAGQAGFEIAVREGGLKFWANLSDYVDTGLFLDHRVTRSMFRDAAHGKRVLNLFAYTGAFSVYAADGGATEVTTVDWSHTYMEWARRNLELNGFVGPQFHFTLEDARLYMQQLSRSTVFDLAVVDPPTFSNSKRTPDDWQVQRDHIELLNLVLSHLTPGGCVYFSTNFRSFKLQSQQLHASQIHEISRQTVPEDFRNRRIHRCWLLRK